jgi:nicotinamide-nucleotide amidase
VTPGPVMTLACAEEMAEGVRRLTGSDVAVSVTGVGGPGEEEGLPAGTVFVGVATSSAVRAFQHTFTGDAEEVVAKTVRAALDHLSAALPGE